MDHPLCLDCESQLKDAIEAEVGMKDGDQLGKHLGEYNTPRMSLLDKSHLLSSILVTLCDVLSHIEAPSFNVPSDPRG